MFDSKIAKIKDRFGIDELVDWESITPLEVLSIHGVGTVTLDHLRLYLAQHNLCLKNDATPEYWRRHMESIRVCQTLGRRDNQNVAPFRVLVDSMEQKPYLFAGLRLDSGNEVFVPTETRALGVRVGDFYQPMGDYSIEGMQGLVHIERKSIEDCQSTILGWGGRRERFEKELAVLSSMPWCAVVVEGTMDQVVSTIQQRESKKTVFELRKILLHSMIAWQSDYRVPWYFCSSRSWAEYTTFRLLVRSWQKAVSKNQEEMKGELV